MEEGCGRGVREVDVLRVTYGDLGRVIYSA